jgi:general secretion pathway protein L
MLEASQPWILFGYDIRRGLHYIRAGWRDFLWGDASPVLGVIDEVVAAHQATGEVQYFRAGKLVDVPVTPGEVLAQAVVLPDHLALCKTLRIPVAAEADLESMLALEVTSSSPFPKTDTCFGWLISDRRADELVVVLVLSSKSAVMAFIAAQLDSHDAGAYEVWAQVENRMVLVSGFGEAPRLQRNRRRLGRMAIMVSYCLLAVMALVALGAGAKYLELQKVRESQEQVARSSRDAVELRTALASSKSMIAVVNELFVEHPSPHRELQRLTALLGDDTWLALVEIKGSAIKIEGESSDASAVMQQLLDYPVYARVEAPVAIRKVGTGRERFVLNLTLVSPDGSE